MSMTQGEPAVRNGFLRRYGPWAVVAGASQGLGAAFVRRLAERGLDIVAVARRGNLLEELAEECAARYGRKLLPLVADLSEPDSFEQIKAATAALEVGLLVYNAAFPNDGAFLDRAPELHHKIVAVNCMRPVELVHHFGNLMAARGRGGIILMSSLSAFSGSPYISPYGASKAFNLILAEGLWYELRPFGVDVLASCPGAVLTPSYLAGYSGKASLLEPPKLTPDQVAAATLPALGRKAVVIPGAMNKAVSFILRRLVPRRAVVRIMGKTVHDLAAAAE